MIVLLAIIKNKIKTENRQYVLFANVTTFFKDHIKIAPKKYKNPPKKCEYAPKKYKNAPK